LPCRILENDVIAALDAAGFAGKHDFVHVPTRAGARTKSNLGYAFINFVDSATASCFSAHFTGYRFPGTHSAKVCSVRPARVQGTPRADGLRQNRM
jgi:hypothetical protein